MRTARLTLSTLLILWIGGCGSSGEEPVEAPAPTHAEAVAPEPLPSGALVPVSELDAERAVEIPTPAGFEFEVSEPAEYQIDVRGDADPKMYLYRGETLVEEADDGGQGVNSRIVRFLEPGAYSLRIVEARGRPFSAQASIQRLEALEPVQNLELGTQSSVAFEAHRPLQRPTTERAASKALRLSITETGNYRCTADADNGRDVRLALIQEGRVLARNDDAAPDVRTAQVELELAAGSYEVRVWDWLKRGDMHVQVLCSRR